jgi:hypothetical protein
VPWWLVLVQLQAQVPLKQGLELAPCRQLVLVLQVQGSWRLVLAQLLALAA